MHGQVLVYEDFVIEATGLQEDGSFRVRVLSSPIGGMTSASAIPVRINWPEIETSLGGGLRESGYLAPFGRMLADLLLPEGWVRSLYWRSVDRVRDRRAGLRLRLQFEDAQLADVPWEFLWLDAGLGQPEAMGFLALQPYISITRNDVVSPTRDLPSALPQIRLMATLYAPERYPLEFLHLERESMQKTFDAVNQGADAIAVSWVDRPTRDTLASAFGAFDIFHFSGHGGRRPEEGEVDADATSGERFILLANDTETGDEYPCTLLAQNLASTPVRLVVLNSSLLGASMLQSFTRAGVPAAITPRGMVSDRAAALFAARLYSCLTLGYSIDESVAQARYAIYYAMGLGQKDWGEYILYLQSRTGNLFPAAPETAGDTPDPPPLIKVRRSFGTVAGTVSGVDVGAMEHLTRTLLEIEETVDRVEPTGTVTGIRERSDEPGSAVTPPSTNGATGERPAPAPANDPPATVEAPAMSTTFLTWRNIDIEVTATATEGAYGVRVIGQAPGGEMRPDETETVTFAPSDLAAPLAKLEYRKASQEELIALGEKLADLLLPGRVRELFTASRAALKEGEGLRLRLRIEPLALAALPWELTYLQTVHGEKVPSDFLALQRDVSITRYEVTGASPGPLTGKNRIRIVAALADPVIGDQPPLQLDADKNAIAAAIAELKERAGEQAAAIEATCLEPATRDTLLKGIRGADIFHFAGHGAFTGTETAADGTLRKTGAIALEAADSTPDRYPSDQLAIALGNEGVRLVVLGACNSASRDEGGAWSGVAPALVREGIPAVVGMQYRVLDSSAGLFVTYLYAELLAGASIDEAVFAGRQAVFNRSGLAKRDWAVPVVYLRAEDGVLFPLPEEHAAGGPESPTLIVQRTFGTVRGRAVGAKIDEVLGGRIEIRDAFDIVEQGGEAIGFEGKTFGRS